METLVRIDDGLIDFAEKTLFSVRDRLDMSFPRAMGICASTVVFLLALSAFLSPGDPVTVKIPLLMLYAVLAYAIGRTVLRHLAWFSNNWGPDIERVLTRDALGNRTKLRPLRALFGFFAFISVFWTLLLSLKSLTLGAISLPDAVRDILSSLLGLPILMAYLYLICARPSWKPTL